MFQSYKYSSLDETSRFTIVPLNGTAKVSFIMTIITDACTKSAFSLNNKIYKQIERAPM